MRNYVKRYVTILVMVFVFGVMLTSCGKSGKETLAEDEGEIKLNAVDTADHTEKSDHVSDDDDVKKDDADAQKDAGKDVEREAQKDQKTGTTGNPVADHGKLSVKGTQLVDAKGKACQLRGVSTHGLAWFPQYVNYDAFQTMKEEWGINCVRLAMYSGENNGYCTGGDKEKLKQLVNDGVEYATRLGLYVIVDWHVLGDQDPNVYKTEALAFFEEMSEAYADYDNVIYEICNEPNGGTTWQQVKSYAEEVIPVIKKHDPEAVIIVGTPTWSQDVDIAAKDPITGYDDIMYAIHFYADTHQDSIRQKMLTALDAGIPIFCSEFGICDASGAGANNYEEGNIWIQTLDDKGISYCIWNLSNKDETSSLIKSSCYKTSGWTENDLSESGKWYCTVLREQAEDTGWEDDNINKESDNKDNHKDNKNNTGLENKQNDTDAGKSADGNQGDLKVSAKCSNQWSDGSKYFYQYDVNVKNDGAASVSGWSIQLSFDQAVTIDQSWNGTYSVSGGSITIKPVDYNCDIESGQSVDVGLIICADKEVKLKK